MTKQSLIETLRNLNNEKSQLNTIYKKFHTKSNINQLSSDQSNSNSSNNSNNALTRQIKSLTREIAIASNEEDNQVRTKELLMQLNNVCTSEVKSRNSRKTQSVFIAFLYIAFVVLAIGGFIVGLSSLKIYDEFKRILASVVFSFIYFLPSYLLAYFAPVYRAKNILGGCALFANIVFNLTVISGGLIVELHTNGLLTLVFGVLLLALMNITAIAVSIGYFKLVYENFY